MATKFLTACLALVALMALGEPVQWIPSTVCADAASSRSWLPADPVSAATISADRSLHRPSVAKTRRLRIPLQPSSSEARLQVTFPDRVIALSPDRGRPRQLPLALRI